jgi:tetratricopeptide (TPR) repeat protein
MGRFHNRTTYERPKPQISPAKVDSTKFLEFIAVAEAATDWEKKLDLYEKALIIEDRSDIRRKAAYCALHLNNYRLARAHDQRAIELDPNNTYSWVGLVVAGAYLGDRILVENAFHEVEKGASADSRFYLEAAFYYGEQLYRTGQRKEAKTYLNQVVQSRISDDYMVRLRHRASTYLSNV